MTNLILRIIFSTIAVLGAAYVLPGVSVMGFGTALMVAIVLGLLNAFVRPILTFLSLPVTILTLGLFLLVINVIIIKIADALIDGFSVENWVYALVFGFLVSIITSVLNSFLKD